MASVIIDHLVREMRQHLPFSQMPLMDVTALAQAATERYAPPSAEILGPGGGVPDHMYWLRQGRVSAQQLEGHQALELDVGDFWPLGALLAQRPVRSKYVAQQDCFYLCWPWAEVQALFGQSPVWADFLNHRVQRQLAHSLKNLRELEIANAQLQSRLSAPLSQLPSKNLVSLNANVSVRESLRVMKEKKTGSVLLLDDTGQLAGILTRWDVLERIALAQMPLDRPTREVMTQPVRTVDVESTGIDAALLMSRFGLRHLPVLDHADLVNLVSERDLFHLQTHTLSQTVQAIEAAQGLHDLQVAASQIRQLTRQWVQQGMHASNLTALISDLNDRLTKRLIKLELSNAGLDDMQMCWLALGSEGRSEQTIATDQDNALIYAGRHSDQDPDPDLVKSRWLAFALQVNTGLEACGFPLCRGNVMASNPQCCLTLTEWKQHFSDLIDRGTPEDLLKAAIFFDFRGLAGQQEWVTDLRHHVMLRIKSTPKFIHQCVENSRAFSVPLNWHGGLQGTQHGHENLINIKLSGTAMVVDAARIMALAKGITATRTVERLHEAALKLNIPETDYKSWITAFEYLQMLRLQRQIQLDAEGLNANQINLESMNSVDKRMLKVAFSTVRNLQQRLLFDDLR